MAKKTTLKFWTGNVWEDLFPKTHADLIIMADGQNNLQHLMNEVVNSSNKAYNAVQEAFGQIEQAEQIAKGAQQAISFTSYEELVNELNSSDKDAYKIGQSIYIEKMDVPDLWVSDIDDYTYEYVYTSDENFVTDLKNEGYVQVGHYRLCQLETGKVPLENYLPLTGGKVTGQITVKGEDNWLFKNETTISGATITLDGLGKVTIGTIGISKTISDTITNFLYPEKSGTLALDKDFEPINEKLATVEESITDVKHDIAVLHKALMQTGFIYTADDVNTWNERTTADGEEIVDGSKAVLKKVVGNTVRCEQLIGMSDIVKTLAEGKYLVSDYTNFHIEAGKTYTLSWDYNVIACPDAINIGFGIAEVKDDDGKEQDVVYKVNYDNQGENASGRQTVTFTPEYSGKLIIRFIRYGIASTAETIISISNIMLNAGSTALPYQPLFTGLKSASFGGIESTNADGTESSTLDFPKTPTPLGVTIDFENKKITDYGVTLVLTGEEGWKVANGYTYDGQYYSSIYGDLLKEKESRAKAIMTDGYADTKGGYGVGAWWVGVSSKFLYLLGAERYFDFTQYPNLSGVTDEQIKTEMVNNWKETLLAEWTAYLAQRYADGNPVTIRYVSSTLQSETDFTDGNEYTARNKGRERVRKNDGAEYGADNTLTVNYLYVGGKDDEA